MAITGGSLSAEQNKQIEETIGSYLTEGDLQTVLFVASDGHLINQTGNTEFVNPEEIGSLISANFASTQAIASKMGETEFKAFFIQGDSRDLYIHSVSDAAILVTFFDKTTTLGMVKVFAERTVKALEGIMAAGGGDEGMSVGGGFADSALEELDTILGG